MTLTSHQSLITVLVIAAATILTRALPFALFPDNRETPKYIVYLGQVLPYALMGFLVVYCLKGISLISSPFGIPEAIGIICVVFLYLWRKNILLSIAGGTMAYMVLVQTVFS
ncbi:MAG TPA: branched-chain amino acid transporter AzlD [Ruminiclostridium sp.]|jgi:branched-subunit amino acid transport protein AzlD|nr:branched-chain amino acid transporter AzlD [Ruminiclostridium sp.]